MLRDPALEAKGCLAGGARMKTSLLHPGDPLHSGHQTFPPSLLCWSVQCLEVPAKARALLSSACFAKHAQIQENSIMLVWLQDLV